MWLLICDQAQERGITDKQLKYRVDGKVKEEITEAYNASLMDFFPKLRTFLSQLREMQKATEDKLNKGLEKKVAVEQKKIMKLIETELAKLG